MNELYAAKEKALQSQQWYSGTYTTPDIGNYQLASKQLFNLLSKFLSRKTVLGLGPSSKLELYALLGPKVQYPGFFKIQRKKMNESGNQISVINIENIYYNRGFVDCTNIQEEYRERAEVILERLQDKSRGQDNPKEKRGKQCDHLKSLFHQKLWFLCIYQGRPVAQVTGKAAAEERHHFSSYIPTIWAVDLTRPVEHEILLIICPRNVRIMVIHPKE